MSAFPKLKPSARGFSKGSKPMSTAVSMSGRETRMTFGSKAAGDVLTLSFQNISESVAQQILKHYQDQEGMLLPFVLPTEVWAGWNNPSGFVDPNLEWRYTQPPEVEAVQLDIMSVTVSLESLV